MDKILFSERLRKLIEQKFGSLAAFARVYDAKYNPGTLCNTAISPHKGTINTIKKYVSSKSATIPSLDKIDNMCQLLDCDIDYLLGKIEQPKHIYEAMHNQCGLTKEATEQLIYWKNLTHWYSTPLNTILTSANFDHALYHASELMKEKPRLENLRQVHSDWISKTYSQPKPANGYPSNDGLRNMLDTATTKCDIAKLHLNEYLLYLISELEKVSLENHNKGGK